MPSKRFQRPKTFDQVCEAGLDDFISEHPQGNQEDYMRFMIQNYYGQLLAFGEEMNRASLMAFAEQIGLPPASDK